MAVVLLLVMLLFGVAAMLAAGFSPVQSEIEGREKKKVNLKLLQVVYFVLCSVCICKSTRFQVAHENAQHRVQGRGSRT